MQSREQQAAYARLEQESSASISRRADEVHQLQVRSAVSATRRVCCRVTRAWPPPPPPSQRLHDENKELREQLDTAMSTLKRVREREASAAGALTGQVRTVPPRECRRPR